MFVLLHISKCQLVFQAESVFLRSVAAEEEHTVKFQPLLWSFTSQLGQLEPVPIYQVFITRGGWFWYYPHEKRSRSWSVLTISVSFTRLFILIIWFKPVSRQRAGEHTRSPPPVYQPFKCHSPAVSELTGWSLLPGFSRIWQENEDLLPDKAAVHNTHSAERRFRAPSVEKCEDLFSSLLQLANISISITD